METRPRRRGHRGGSGAATFPRVAPRPPAPPGIANAAAAAAPRGFSKPVPKAYGELRNAPSGWEIRARVGKRRGGRTLRGRCAAEAGARPDRSERCRPADCGRCWGCRRGPGAGEPPGLRLSPQAEAAGGHGRSRQCEAWGCRVGRGEPGLRALRAGRAVLPSVSSRRLEGCGAVGVAMSRVRTERGAAGRPQRAPIAARGSGLGSGGRSGAGKGGSAAASTPLSIYPAAAQP